MPSSFNLLNISVILLWYEHRKITAKNAVTSLHGGHTGRNVGSSLTWRYFYFVFFSYSWNNIPQCLASGTWLEALHGGLQQSVGELVTVVGRPARDEDVISQQRVANQRHRKVTRARTTWECANSASHAPTKVLKQLLCFSKTIFRCRDHCSYTKLYI